jgi:molybdate/tungstate transport system substrate-binding protein
MSFWFVHRPWLLLLLTISAVGCRPRREIVVFHASSLSRVFGELSERLREQGGWSVRLEPSGSNLAARKVSEHGLRADVVAVADASVLDGLLVPRFAPATVLFATNELVLAHLGHSPGTADVTQENWPELVLGGARLGCANPDLAPIGYHTLTAWQLAELELQQPGLAQRLDDACHRQALAQDENELVALLEAKAIDYAFLYGSTAEDHRLKVTRLPPSVNLSLPALAASYARASVEVHLKTGEPPTRLQGRPITYGLAVLRDAPSPAGAKAFVELLTGEEGQRTLSRHGFFPLEAGSR